MAQSYFPTRPASSLKEPAFTGMGGEKQLRVEDVQEAYIESKDR
jgi:mitofusin